MPNFKMKYGSLELDVEGESDYIFEVLDRLPQVIQAMGRQASIGTLLSEVPQSGLTSGDSPLPEQINQAEMHDTPRVSLVEFLKSKGPTSQIGQAVCIAYYMTQTAGPEFGSRDLTDWWKLSKQPIPRNVPDLINRACQRGYLTPLTNEVPYLYQLTTRGERHVQEMVLTEGERPHKAKRKPPSGGRKPLDSPVVKAVIETPAELLNIGSYSDLYTLNSVVREVCWLMLVCKKELKIDELSSSDISVILSQKFGLKRSIQTISKAISRNPKAFDKLKRGAYKLMKFGEDLVNDPIEEAI